MRLSYIPSSLRSILFSFGSCFTAPSLENFVSLVCGWILCQGSHAVSDAIVAARAYGLSGRHHAALYRFLARARWTVDDLGRVLFGLLLPFLPEEIDIAIDDTLCHRSGPQIFGAGMHHDSAGSTYGGQGGPRVSFAFGHNWVVLSVWTPLPWNGRRGLAVPVLFRLYRPKKRCPAWLYRKRTELAREMLQTLCAWLPEGRRLNLATDQEYACQTLLADLPDRVEFTGALPMDAALYAPTPRRSCGRGRPPVKGRRLPTPAKLVKDRRRRWEKKTLLLYGREVSILVQTFEATWYTVRGPRPVRVVLTRDPSGRLADRAFFSTNPQRSAEDVLLRVSRRWSLEATFQAGKGVMGIEEPRNGWWRRRHGSRRPWRLAGPQSRGDRGRLAVERTVPLIFTAYGIVIVWYLLHGNPKQDVARVVRRRPWYRQKTEPCYGDMAAALRREFWAHRLSRHAPQTALPLKMRRLLSALGVGA